jgi:putative salt-induced outer membrane protein YdiY
LAKILFISSSFYGVKTKISLWAAAIFAASLLVSAAQPATVTVTNYVTVTVTVTNVVTITNIVPPTPTPPAVAAIGAGVPPAPVIIPKYPWQSAVSVGLTMTRGNSDSMLFTANFLTQRKTPFDEYKIELKGAYGNQDDVQTVNNYQGSVQWNHLFTPRFYNYVRAEGVRDIIAGINYRVTVGPGLGYYLMKSTNTTLAAEAGGAFVAQGLADSSTTPPVDNGGNETFATLRFAQRFEHKVNDHARIWENAEIRPQVDNFENYIVSAEIGVETTLSKSFTLKTFLDNEYNNLPAPGKLKNDAKIVAAVGYKF